MKSLLISFYKGLRGEQWFKNMVSILTQVQVQPIGLIFATRVKVIGPCWRGCNEFRVAAGSWG